MKNLYIKTYLYLYTLFALYFLAVPLLNGDILLMNTTQIAIVIFMKFILLSILLIGLEKIYWKIKPVTYNHFNDIHK